MSRDQRLHDNYCVQLGYDLSYENYRSLYIGIDFFEIKANERQKEFILVGLAEMGEEVS